MPHPEPVKSAPRTPSAMHSHAMDNLRFIRETMESSAAFTAVPGRGMVAMGLVGLAAGVLAAGQPAATSWLAVWLAAAVIAAALGGWAMIVKARGCGEALTRGVGRRFLFSLIPPVLVAVVLTAELAGARPEAIPGVWLLLYAVAVLAGGAFSVPPVPLMGSFFLFLGLVAFATPHSWSNWLLTIGFGGIHVVFGLLIARRHGG